MGEGVSYLNTLLFVLLIGSGYTGGVKGGYSRLRFFYYHWFHTDMVFLFRLVKTV